MVVGIDGAVGLWEISVAMIHSLGEWVVVRPVRKGESFRAGCFVVALVVSLFYYRESSKSICFIISKQNILGVKMFKSNIKWLMDKKNITMRQMTAKTGLSSSTLAKARTDENIGECRLSTLARIGSALGVKTKKLYEEMDALTDENDSKL